MRTLIVLVSLLLVPYGLLALFGVGANLRGRIGLALVFAFTGIGHFVKTAEMVQMLPGWVPQREFVIYFTGVLELVAAVALLVPAVSRVAGIFLCLFLVAVFPANVFAAFQRVDFGGHGAGPVYLALRLPLQVLLIGWTWWFAVRRPPP
jgi:uncharacterized membrane protein